MVVNVDKTKDKVIGNGTSGPYSFTGIKLINPEEDLAVFIEDSNGDLGSQLVVNIDYLINYSETDTSASFDIDLLEDVTIPNTEALFVNRGVPLDQSTKLTRSGEINTRTYEKMTDKTTLQNQDQNSLIESAFRLKPNVTTDVDLELGDPTGQEGKAVLVNETGDGLTYSDQSITEIEEGLEDLDAAVLAAENSATNAATSEANAAISADEAEESAAIAKESFKGDWVDDYVDPISGLDGYTIGNTVVFGANQWWSKIDQNTAVPPLEYNTPSTEWEHFLRGAITNDEFIADVKEAVFLGDGVETDFDLTDATANFRPTNKNQILAVYIDTDIVAEEEYTITIDGVTGHSIIMFNTAPPAPVDPDGTYNIIVKGATPKLIEIDTPIGYRDDTIRNGSNITDLFPKMTSNVLPAGEECWATTQFDPVYAPYKAFDKTSAEANRWASSTNPSVGTPQINIRKMTSLKPIKSIGLAVFNLTETPTDFTLVYTTDDMSGYSNVDLTLNNIAFTTVKTITGQSWVINEITYFNLDSEIPTSATAWGIVCTSATGLISISRIEGYEQEFLPNQVLWKGEVRSEDNSVNIVANDYIRSTPIFNANSQYTDQGQGVYNYEDYTYTLNGSILSAPYFSGNGYSASDFDARVKFEFNTSNNTKPIIGLGSGSGNLGIVAKTNTSGLMQLFISSNGTSWDISNGLTGTKIYNINAVYVVRVYRDVSNWYLDWSDDNGQTWNTDITAISSLDMFEQTLNWNWGADFTPATDIAMTGKIYLDGTSLFLNGEFVVEPQDPDTATLPYSDYYYFIGYDNTETLKLERTVNKDGTGLPTITGAKRRIGDYKDVAFPTDGSGDLAYFERNFGTWEFELWSGSATGGALTLNSNISNYTSLQYKHVKSAVSYYIDSILSSDMLLLNSTSDYFECRRSSASNDYVMNYYTTDSNELTVQYRDDVSLVQIKGVK